MAAARILGAARARIADPLHWTIGTMARDETGAVAYPTGRDAVCWCALGALRAEQRSVHHGPEVRALQEAAAKLFAMSVAKVNDKLGHSAVLAMYDDAIASAEAGV